MKKIGAKETIQRISLGDVLILGGFVSLMTGIYLYNGLDQALKIGGGMCLAAGLVLAVLESKEAR